MTAETRAALVALVARWRNESVEQEATGKEAESKQMLVTAASLIAESLSLQICAEALAAILEIK